MARLGRLKSGLTLLIMLHLLVHPAFHLHSLPGLLTASAGHSLIREEASHPDDVCSLCRVANALHAPAPLSAAVHLMSQVGSHRAEAVSVPRAVERWQQIPRAPPVSVNL
jgi:hypothetical protein